MSNRFWMSIKHLGACLFLLALAGCAGTSVVSKSGASSQGYKLKSAHVVWIKNSSVSFETSILINSYYGAKPLTDADKDVILAPYKMGSYGVMGQLLSHFEKQLASSIQGQLAKNDVHDGNDITVEFLPLSVHHAVNGGRRIHVRVAIKHQSDSKELWAEEIETHATKDDSDEILLDNFINTAIDELKKAGWLSS